MLTARRRTADRLATPASWWKTAPVRRDDSEIIEVFDVDADYFGSGVDRNGNDVDRSNNDNDNDNDNDNGNDNGNDATGYDDSPATHRPRWDVPAGLAAVAAVIAMSIGTGSSDTGSTRSAATTRPAVTAPITLAPLPTTTDPAAASSVGDPARYVVDLPAGVAVIGANEFDIREAGAPTQLWATPGATATTGRWVEISAAGAFGSRLEATADAYRITLGDSVALVEPGLTAAESTELSFIRDSALVTLTGHNISVDFLVAVAGSLSVDDAGDPQIDSSLGEFDEFRLIDDRPAGSWLFGEGRAAGLYAAYGSGDDFRPDGPNFVNVTVGRPKPADGSYSTRVPFIVDPIRVFQAVDGSLGIAGPIVNTGIRFNRPVSSAHWVDADGWLVASVMDGSVDDVIEVASTARVDADEWNRLAFAPRDDPEFIEGNPGAAYVAATTDQATGQATGQAALVEWGSTPLTYSWRTTSTTSDQNRTFEVESHRFSPDQPTISTAATDGNQMVFATVPRILEGATLTVVVGQDPPVSVLLTDRDPTFAVLSAVLTTTTFGAVTAVLTAADGTVIATWPSPQGL